MRNDTASPLRISFPGPASGWEGARLRRGWVRLCGLHLGGHPLGPVVCDRAMLAALQGADAGTTLRLGHLLAGRWVLSASRDGRTVRHGIFGFLVCNLLLGLAITVPALALGEVAALALHRPHTVIWPFFLADLFWMGLVGMNYAAWFGFPRR